VTSLSDVVCSDTELSDIVIKSIALQKDAEGVFYTPDLQSEHESSERDNVVIHKLKKRLRKHVYACTVSNRRRIIDVHSTG